MNLTEKTLGKCGCCEGVEVLTPEGIRNDAGLSALLFRIGTHGTFKESMLRGLSDSEVLRLLTNRENDDHTIALIDAWATVLDVLTFYNERFINEGYLRTAVERLSLVELARHISYRPKPGVAASTWLAFSMDESPGAPLEAIAPIGMKVQSIPGQDEKPQIFETIEEILAKTKWNAIKAKLSETQKLVKGSTQLYLQGTSTQLQIGDRLLIVGNERISDDPGSERWDIRAIQSITPDEKANHTLVTWREGLGHPAVDPASVNVKVYVFRQRAALFGYNAPDIRIMSNAVRFALGKSKSTPPPTEWANFNIAQGQQIFLDAVYPKILADSWLALIKPDYEELYRVKEASASSRTDFGLSTKTTRISLDTNENLSTFPLRDTVVLAQSELLEMAKAPVLLPVFGDTIELDEEQPELKKDQHLIIRGQLLKQVLPYEPPKNTNIPTPPTSLNQPEIVSEHIEIERMDGAGKIVLKAPLTHVYLRHTVEINANVALATHGETKSEILGSGNGALVFQKFRLKQKPLTYIASSASPNGAETTLEIRVNDIKWKESQSLYGKSTNARVFVSRSEDDGTTYIQFGDGITGTRLPSGAENIRARYRVGIGLEGEVKAGQLSLLMTPQLGIKSVVNPLPATGADEPEVIENIRSNAPLTVLTLDRIVSILDYENFASAYAGIGKARADLIWKGEERIVHLTVASASEGGIDELLKKRLLEAIDNARHENFQVVINSFEKLLFKVIAKVKIHEDYLEDKVKANVREKLLARFNFTSRNFGQSVTPSEVIAVVQSVAGVVAVDLDKIGDHSSLSVLQSSKARRPEQATNNDTTALSTSTILPAQLLLVDPENIEINIMA